jgi:hypothetical protein
MRSLPSYSHDALNNQWASQTRVTAAPTSIMQHGMAVMMQHETTDAIAARLLHLQV